MQLIIPLLFIPFNGVATYSFGIMGAAIYVGFSNFCLQCLFIHKAQQMGSSYKDHLSVFWSGLFSFWRYSFVFHTYATGLSLMVRIFECAVLIGLVLCYAYRQLSESSLNGRLFNN